MWSNSDDEEEFPANKRFTKARNVANSDDEEEFPANKRFTEARNVVKQ